MTDFIILVCTMALLFCICILFKDTQDRIEFAKNEIIKEIKKLNDRKTL